jgi:hypothetical protein
VRIFISYRRDDTRDLSGRLADRLRADRRLGDVFFDVNSIEAGAAFRTEIDKALARTRDPVCLVMIGSAWRGNLPDGTTRLDRPDDVVRGEIEAALKGGLRVIPVLAGGVPMPTPDSLPESIRPLSSLSAVTLRHESFDQDMDRLRDAILRRRRAGLLARLRNDRPILASALYAAIGILLAAVLLLLAALINRMVSHRSLDETLGDTGAVWILILASLAAGAIVGVVRSRRPA